MKWINRSVSMLVLVSFLSNAIFSDLAFSRSLNNLTNGDKLAAPSKFDDIAGIERNDIGRIRITLTEQLAAITKTGFPINLGTFQTILGKETLKEKTVFQPKDMQFFFHEIGLTQDGLSVMCRVKDNSSAKPRTYYVVFSPLKDANGGFPITVYPEKEYHKYTRDKYGRMPGASFRHPAHIAERIAQFTPNAPLPVSEKVVARASALRQAQGQVPSEQSESRGSASVEEKADAAKIGEAQTSINMGTMVRLFQSPLISKALAGIGIVLLPVSAAVLPGCVRSAPSPTRTMPTAPKATPKPETKPIAPSIFHAKPIRYELIDKTTKSLITVFEDKNFFIMKRGPFKFIFNRHTGVISYDNLSTPARSIKIRPSSARYYKYVEKMQKILRDAIETTTGTKDATDIQAIAMRFMIECDKHDKEKQRTFPNRTPAPQQSRRASAPVRRSSSGQDTIASEGGSGISPDVTSPPLEKLHKRPVREDRWDEEVFFDSYSSDLYRMERKIRMTYKDDLSPFIDLLKNKAQIGAIGDIDSLQQPELAELSERLRGKIRPFENRFKKAHRARDNERLAELNSQIIELLKTRLKVQLLLLSRWLETAKTDRRKLGAGVSALRGAASTCKRISSEYGWQRRKETGNLLVEKIRAVGRLGIPIETFLYKDLDIKVFPKDELHPAVRVTIRQERWVTVTLQDGTKAREKRWRDISYEDWPSALRSQIHTIASQEEYYANILYYMADIDYCRERLSGVERKLPEYIREQIEESLTNAFMWAKRAKGENGRKRSAANLELALEKLGVNNRPVVIKEIENAIINLQDRRSEIEKIKRNIDKRLESIYIHIRNLDVAQTLRQAQESFRSGDITRAGELVSDLYGTYFSQIADDGTYKYIQARLSQLMATLARLKGITAKGGRAETEYLNLADDFRSGAAHILVAVKRQEVRTAVARPALDRPDRPGSVRASASGKKGSSQRRLPISNEATMEKFINRVSTTIAAITSDDREMSKAIEILLQTLSGGKPYAVNNVRKPHTSRGSTGYDDFVSASRLARNPAAFRKLINQELRREEVQGQVPGSNQASPEPRASASGIVKGSQTTGVISKEDVEEVVSTMKRILDVAKETTNKLDGIWISRDGKYSYRREGKDNYPVKVEGVSMPSSLHDTLEIAELDSIYINPISLSERYLESFRETLLDIDDMVNELLRLGPYNPIYTVERHGMKLVRGSVTYGRYRRKESGGLFKGEDRISTALLTPKQAETTRSSASGSAEHIEATTFVNDLNRILSGNVVPGVSRDNISHVNVQDGTYQVYFLRGGAELNKFRVEDLAPSETITRLLAPLYNGFEVHAGVTASEINRKAVTLLVESLPEVLDEIRNVLHINTPDNYILAKLNEELTAGFRFSRKFDHISRMSIWREKIDPSSTITRYELVEKTDGKLHLSAMPPASGAEENERSRQEALNILRDILRKGGEIALMDGLYATDAMFFVQNFNTTLETVEQLLTEEGYVRWEEGDLSHDERSWIYDPSNPNPNMRIPPIPTVNELYKVIETEGSKEGPILAEDLKSNIGRLYAGLLGYIRSATIEYGEEARPQPAKDFYVNVREYVESLMISDQGHPDKRASASGDEEMQIPLDEIEDIIRTVNGISSLLRIYPNQPQQTLEGNIRKAITINIETIPGITAEQIQDAGNDIFDRYIYILRMLRTGGFTEEQIERANQAFSLALWLHSIQKLEPTDNRPFMLHASRLARAVTAAYKPHYLSNGVSDKDAFITILSAAFLQEAVENALMSTIATTHIPESIDDRESYLRAKVSAVIRRIISDDVLDAISAFLRWRHSDLRPAESETGALTWSLIADAGLQRLGEEMYSDTNIVEMVDEDIKCALDNGDYYTIAIELKINLQILKMARLGVLPFSGEGIEKFISAICKLVQSEYSQFFNSDAYIDMSKADKEHLAREFRLLPPNDGTQGPRASASGESVVSRQSLVDSKYEQETIRNTNDESFANKAIEPSTIDYRLSTNEYLTRLAKIAGLEIPTHPNERYTLLLTQEFFANGELETHRLKYGDRFEVNGISGRTQEQFVDNLLAKAKGIENRTIALIPDDLTLDQLERIKNSRIRFIRTKVSDLLNAKSERDSFRESFQLNAYTMMLLARRIDKSDGRDSSIYKLLSFYVRSHFTLEDKVAIEDYIDAIMNSDIARLIKGCLVYRPIEPYKVPDHDTVAVTLISV